MRTLQIRCAAYVALVTCLKQCLETNGEYKEFLRTLNAEVNTQKDRISELEKNVYWVDELTKENTNLMTKLTNLRKQMDKAKADAVDEF